MYYLFKAEADIEPFITIKVKMFWEETIWTKVLLKHLKVFCFKAIP